VRRRQSEKKDKKLADNERLLRWWKKFHREERDVVLAGPHSAVLGELLRMIKNLEHIQPSQLIGLAHSIDWVAIDTNTKLVTLHEFNAAVTRFREKRNPDEPIDDTVSDEPPFRALKAILFPSSRAPTGAQPGMSIHKPAA
jgi:hypothetical protein